MNEGQSRSLGGGAVLRRARPGDEDGILDCIRGLAEYEKEPDAVQTTADDLRRVLFGADPSVFAHVVEKDSQVVAIAVWFLNYSTDCLHGTAPVRSGGPARLGLLRRAIAALPPDAGEIHLQLASLEYIDVAATRELVC